MKKILLLVAVVGVTFFASCEEKPEESKQKPFPIGEWCTEHQYYSLTIDDVEPSSATEEIKRIREQETSGTVMDVESYQLTFNENGTGYGSGAHPDGTGRYNFSFTWRLSGDQLSISGSDGTGVFFRSVWYGEDIASGEVADENITWEIEESSTNNMVLSRLFSVKKFFNDYIYDSWEETHTYRYTFEKTK
ncbi:MAG: hypothetical protein LBV38_07205 [Alistipes sp.]|jgi:hypothetical protein|nr:hypothetical protein [Alistipes sp.]